MIRKKAKIGRNEPCLCGSGRKYKKCCSPGTPRVASSPPSSCVECGGETRPATPEEVRAINQDAEWMCARIEEEDAYPPPLGTARAAVVCLECDRFWCMLGDSEFAGNFGASRVLGEPAAAEVGSQQALDVRQALDVLRTQQRPGD